MLSTVSVLLPGFKLISSLSCSRHSDSSCLRCTSHAAIFRHTRDLCSTLNSLLIGAPLLPQTQSPATTAWSSGTTPCQSCRQLSTLCNPTPTGVTQQGWARLTPLYATACKWRPCLANGPGDMAQCLSLPALVCRTVQGLIGA
jgi:hypothetical protein